MNGAIAWADLTTLCGILAFVSAPIVWVWRDRRTAHDELLAEHAKLEMEFANYRVHVAETYVTNGDVARLEDRMGLVEERITKSVDALGLRFDRALNVRS